MRSEIDAYLRNNGAQYTTKALRQQLLYAGHEAAEVDATLQELLLTGSCMAMFGRPTGAI